MDSKKELIEEISKLIESDPNAIPMELNMLDFLSEDDLVSVLKNLYRSKDSRSEQNEVWFKELCK